MEDFTVYPAIDLRRGRVVRLKYGDPDRLTAFSDDPLAVAEQWIDAGSNWLHVINLDGALDESGEVNRQILAKLTKLGAKVQFGGGVRTLADIEHVLNMGTARVILGTAAIEDLDMTAEALSRFGPERVVVAVDALDGRVRTRGWQKESAVTPLLLGRQMKKIGVGIVIYTDIGRDGVFSGVDVDGARQLARSTGLSVIASGGIASLKEVEQLRHQVSTGVVGVIIGRALYERRFTLRQALQLAQ